MRLMGGGGRAGRFETRGIVQRGAWNDRWRKIILDALMTIMSAHKSVKTEDFCWLYQTRPVKVLLFGGITMSECLMTIMSAQYSHRTGVEVSFMRDENKKRHVSPVPLSSSLSLPIMPDSATVKAADYFTPAPCSSYLLLPSPPIPHPSSILEYR